MHQDVDTRSSLVQDSSTVYPSASVCTGIWKDSDLAEMLMKQPASHGDWVYLIPSSWMDRWKKYISAIKDDVLDVAPPGPIDTSEILTPDGVLKPDLCAALDFRTVPAAAWMVLTKRYGIRPIEIPRRMTQCNEEAKVEPDLYPVKHAVYLVVDRGEYDDRKCPPARISVYRSSAVSDLKGAVERALNIPSHIFYSLWAMSYGADKDKHHVPPTALSTSYRLDLEDSNRMISSFNIAGADLAVDLNTPITEPPPPILEPSQDFGSNPEPVTMERTQFATEENAIMAIKESSTQYEPGYCGLKNIGNTCYMNSALQCLSNTRDLMRYFIEKQHLVDLNCENPLGMKGDLASAYAALICTMWSGKTPWAIPQNFKRVIESFNSTFKGKLQHDSQELLSFLLDGLHEDLNRIKTKQYIELPDFGDKSDYKIAQQCWLYHKARNDSIVVDIFQGQLKSQLVCNSCNKVSITFDPFMYLSLPLPVQKSIHIKVVFVPYNPETREKRIVLTLEDTSRIEQAKEQVTKTMGIDDPSTLLVAEIYEHKIRRIFSNHDVIDTLNGEIYVYEMSTRIPASIRTKRPWSAKGKTGFNNLELVIFPVHFCISTDDDDSHNSCITPLKPFGFPILLDMARQDAADPTKIYDYVTQHVERFTRTRPAKETHISGTDYMELDGAFAENGTVHKDKTVQLSGRISSAAIAAEGQLLWQANDLFEMKLFSDIGSSSTGSSTSFTRDNLYNLTERHDPRNPLHQPWQPLIKQGDEVVTVWTMLRAREVFGFGFNTDLSTFDEINRDVDESNTFSREQCQSTRREKSYRLTLYDCLSEFVQEEVLERTELWYCPRCKKHQDAKKKIDFWFMPETLVIHLKRFRNSLGLHDKVDVFVDFPIESLDLTDIVASSADDRKHLLGFEDRMEEDEQVIYDLYAVDNHYGGMDGGHYTAYAQNPETTKWLKFDDDYVAPVAELESIKTNAAYLLFYKRRHTSTITWPLPPHTVSEMVFGDGSKARSQYK